MTYLLREPFAQTWDYKSEAWRGGSLRIGNLNYASNAQNPLKTLQR